MGTVASGWFILIMIILFSMLIMAVGDHVSSDFLIFVGFIGFVIAVVFFLMGTFFASFNKRIENEIPQIVNQQDFRTIVVHNDIARVTKDAEIYIAKPETIRVKFRVGETFFGNTARHFHKIVVDIEQE